MKDYMAAASTFLYAAATAFMIYGWVAYQDRTWRRTSNPLPWPAKLRWLFTALILILSLIGYFTIVMRISGMAIQLPKGPQYEQVQEQLYRLK